MNGIVVGDSVPLICRASSDKAAETEDMLKVNVAHLSFTYPNHNQGIERCVKLVSDASESVHGFVSRNWFIRACVKFRCLMSQFDTKKHFR